MGEVIGISKVLAVDDEADALAGYRMGFGRYAQVFTASCGTVALPLAMAERPDAIVVDLRLRNEWGITLIRRFRQLLPDAKIALVSGYISVGSAIAAIRAGADRVIPKPVLPREILRELATHDAHELENIEPAFPTLVRVEWDHIMRALDHTSGNVSAAARLLGMRRTSLQRKLMRPPPP